jgi:PAS domain S-box-containing protein
LSPRQAVVLTTAITTLFATSDFTVPGEFNVAIFYVLSVVASGWSRSRAFLWLTTVTCALLAIAGLAFGPQPTAPVLGAMYVNRLFVAIGLLVTAVIMHRRMSMLEGLEETRDSQARHNELLRDSEARARAIFEQAAVGIALTDRGGRFFQANERLCSITGYSREELLGRTFEEITHPDDISRNRELNEALIAGDLPHFEIEKRYLRRDGSAYWVNLTAALVRGASGEPDYVIAVVEDISARKWAEAELRRVNDELEQRVDREVAKRLDAEHSLHQAQKMEAIGQLTGGIAHDFNNVLTTVMGNLERIVTRSAPDDPLRRMAENALHGAEQGARLTEHLLSFSRRQRLEPQVTEIDRSLGESLALARRAVGEAIELTSKLAPDLWPCCIDRAQLQSALLNLVINARDAMPGGGRVTIAAQNVTLGRGAPDLAAGDYVRLSVEDTGSGMTPEVRAHAVEPFFTTKPAGKGTGLGLSMVYGFAKQSGGTLCIESLLGHGTAVHLYLPRTTLRPDALQPAAPASIEAPRQAATVLIVEDEEDVRQLAAESLQELGYRVLSATNASAAVSLLNSDKVDLLLTDIVIPGGMSGLDLADRARRLHQDIPVLLTTGYPEAIDRAVAHGGMEILRKPFRPHELGAKVHHMLSTAGQPQHLTPVP